MDETVAERNKPMDGKPSNGACGFADPVFVPIENKLGKKQAETICCCCSDLRTGLLIIIAIMIMLLLFESLTVLYDDVSGVAPGLWPIGLVELLYTFTLGYGFLGLYNRNVAGTRFLTRTIIGSLILLFIALITMPLWVPLVAKPACVEYERLQEVNDAELCAQGWNDVQEGRACCDGKIDECTMRIDGSERARCILQQGICAENPEITAYLQAQKPVCETRLEIGMYGFQVLAAVAFGLYSTYLAWISNSLVINLNEDPGLLMCVELHVHACYAFQKIAVLAWPLVPV